LDNRLSFAIKTRVSSRKSIDFFSKKSSKQNNHDGDNDLIKEGTTMPTEQKFEAARQRGRDADVLMQSSWECRISSMFVLQSHSFCTAQTQPYQTRGPMVNQLQLSDCSHFLCYRQASSAIF
jgi:hypothetical protein